MTYASPAAPAATFGVQPTFGLLSERDKQRQFEALYRNTYKRVYNLAYRFAGNVTDAEDLVQETFARAWHAFDRFDGACFKAWVSRILVNLALNRKRKERTLNIISLDAPVGFSDSGEAIQRDIADESSNTQMQAIGGQMDESIQHALMAIPADYRAAVLLSDVEERSYQEISEILGCPIGTVRSRVHRGRSLLRRILSHYVAVER